MGGYGGVVSAAHPAAQVGGVGGSAEPTAGGGRAAAALKAAELRFWARTGVGASCGCLVTQHLVLQQRLKSGCPDYVWK